MNNISQRIPSKIRVRKLTVALMTLLLVSGMMPAWQAQAQSNLNPGVIPPQARPFGGSYGQWSALWWQWAYSIPAARNPLFDETGANCGEGQSGKVWFLAGSYGSFTEPAVRRCRIPQGKAIFFPILNVVAGSGVYDCDPSVPGVPCDVPALRQLTATLMDNPILLEADVDGRPIQNPNSYRAVSPVFKITYPEDNINGLPAGMYYPQVSDGYWIMLAPLSTGAHNIHFKGIVDFFGYIFTTEVTYEITVGN